MSVESGEIFLTSYQLVAVRTLQFIHCADLAQLLSETDVSVESREISLTSCQLVAVRSLQFIHCADLAQLVRAAVL